MPGPAPKNPKVRQRRNKSATAATLEPGNGASKTPNLPAGIKRKETRAWWKAIWESPMAAEYLPSDVQALLRLAVLVDQFWAKPTTTLGTEIAKQEARFGLSPQDRHRMQWKVGKLTKKSAVALRAEGEDPRTLLRMLK